jgi:hypothetical protein
MVSSIFFMLLRYDLFKIETSGKLSWLGPVKDLADAEQRVAKLPPSPRGYCVIDQDTGVRTKVEVDSES